MADGGPPGAGFFNQVVGAHLLGGEAGARSGPAGIRTASPRTPQSIPSLALRSTWNGFPRRVSGSRRTRTPGRRDPEKWRLFPWRIGSSTRRLCALLVCALWTVGEERDTQTQAQPQHLPEQYHLRRARTAAHGGAGAVRAVQAEFPHERDHSWILPPGGRGYISGSVGWSPGPSRWCGTATWGWPGPNPLLKEK